MKIVVTKKEYEVAKNLGFNITKELAKAETITGVSEEDIDTYEQNFTDTFTSEKGIWGKFTVRKDDSIGNNKIIIDVEEECVNDIIDELYNPIIIATIKCIINIVKTFSSVFKKCEKSFNKVYEKWFND